MPGSTPATSQLDWLSSTTAMIVLSWSKATRDLLKSFGWGIRALRQLFASDDGAISSPPAPYHLSVRPPWRDQVARRVTRHPAEYEARRQGSWSTALSPARRAIPWSRGPIWVGRVAVRRAARPLARAGA